MSALPLLTPPFHVKLSPLALACLGPLTVTYKLSCPLTPLFATLMSYAQATENTATLSPFPATLASRVKHKSFICHSYKKHRGWGVSAKAALQSQADHRSRVTPP